jgi:hypothetical protein
VVGLKRHVELGPGRGFAAGVAAVSERREAALYYASLGLPVFPCAIRGKAPLTRHGVKDASSHREHVWQWWQHQPWANVAVAAGPASGWLVVDLDGPEGLASWERLCDRHGQAATLEQTTGRGRHLVFEHPAGVELGNSAGRLGRGIDTRASGGYVIVPPSVHPSGRRYRWVRPDEYPAASGNGNPAPGPFSRQQWHIPRTPAPAPGWLVELLRETRPRAKAATLTVQVAPIPAGLPRHLRARAGEAPGDDRSDQTWALVLGAVEWGLSDGEAMALALTHRPTTDKYGDGDRAKAEVESILGKVRPDHRHVGQPCDRAGCHNRPDWMR